MNPEREKQILQRLKRHQVNNKDRLQLNVVLTGHIRLQVLELAKKADLPPTTLARELIAMALGIEHS